jgi:hypothetical protein
MQLLARVRNLSKVRLPPFARPAKLEKWSKRPPRDLWQQFEERLPRFEIHTLTPDNRSGKRGEQRAGLRGDHSQKTTILRKSREFVLP